MPYKDKNKEKEWKRNHPEYGKQWRLKNKESMKIYHSEFYKKNKKEIDRRNIKYYKEHRKEVYLNQRRNALKNSYGLTIEGYEVLVQSQNGKCCICLLEKPLVVDHDHETGKIRGLLCHKCNSGIGMMCDDIKIVRMAYEYLKKHCGGNNANPYIG